MSSQVNLIVSRLSRLQSEDGNLTTILVNLANVVTSAPSRGLSLSVSILIFIRFFLCLSTLLTRLHVFTRSYLIKSEFPDGFDVKLCVVKGGLAVMLNGNLLIIVLGD